MDVLTLMWLVRCVIKQGAFVKEMPSFGKSRSRIKFSHWLDVMDVQALFTLSA